MARPVIAAEAELAEGVVGVSPLTGDDADDGPLHSIRRLGGLVLTRPPRSAPTEGLVARCRAVGAPLAVLPADRDVAAWIVAAAGAWRRDDLPDAVRRVEAVISFAQAARVSSCGFPDVGPGSLPARWAARAWRPCGRCAGGGIRAGLCARCGCPVEDAS